MEEEVNLPKYCFLDIKYLNKIKFIIRFIYSLK